MFQVLICFKRLCRELEKVTNNNLHDDNDNVTSGCGCALCGGAGEDGGDVRLLPHLLL